MKIDLLKDAYEIIDGIPTQHFNLNRWVHEDGASCSTNGCGTIACAGGWLALHPKFNELGLRMKWNRGNGRGYNTQVVTYGSGSVSAFEALAKVFNIAEQDARKLFSAAYHSDYDQAIFRVRGNNISHKELFKSRVKKFLTLYDYSYNGPAV